MFKLDDLELTEEPQEMIKIVDNNIFSEVRKKEANSIVKAHSLIQCNMYQGCQDLSQNLLQSLSDLLIEKIGLVNRLQELE